jgi:hypothetical protein
MVKCVLISEDPGNISEIETPLENDIYYILKGTPTFIGQVPMGEDESDDHIVIMKCDKSQFNLMENRNVIPGITEQILGPILLVRMNKDAEPQDLTIEEWVPFTGLGVNQTF